jgi:hypothetical protein
MIQLPFTFSSAHCETSRMSNHNAQSNDVKHSAAKSVD